MWITLWGAWRLLRQHTTPILKRAAATAHIDVEHPHRPAHAKPYFCADSDLWFILWVATLGAFLTSLTGEPGPARMIGAAILGAVIGVLIRLVWSTWGQHDTHTPGGHHNEHR